MTRTGGYVRTALALLLVAALLFLALWVPDVVNRWYDKHQMGQVEYVDMTYEPYEIVYYHSFEEELGAISKCLERDVELRLLAIEEGDDALRDAELLVIVNEELEKLLEFGLFYEGVTATEILRRGLSELYPVGNCRDVYPQNVFCWQLTLSLSDGSILVLDVERDYRKVYSGVCIRESLWDRDNVREWIDSLFIMDNDKNWEEHTALWCRYWGLEGELPSPLIVDTTSFRYGKLPSSYGKLWCWGWGLEPKRNSYSIDQYLVDLNSIDTNKMQVW